MSDRYGISTKKNDGAGVVDSEEEEFFVRTVSEAGARVIADLLNEKEDLINEKPLDLHKDFTEWEEQLSDITNEKQELKLQKDEDNRRISFLKRIIDMKIELIKYDGETL